MGTLKVSKERVLKVAETSKKAKKVLETLFPEAFGEVKPFCKLGDVLVREGTKDFYTVVRMNISEKDTIVLFSITYDDCRSCNRLESASAVVGDYEVLSFRDFCVLAGDSKIAKEFRVLDRELIDPAIFDSDN